MTVDRIRLELQIPVKYPPSPALLCIPRMKQRPEGRPPIDSTRSLIRSVTGRINDRPRRLERGRLRRMQCEAPATGSRWVYGRVAVASGVQGANELPRRG